MSARGEFSGQRESITAVDIAMAALSLLWQSIRIPIFAVLRLAEPLIRLMLGVLGLLSMLAAVFYKFFSALAHPPFWSLVGFGVACGLALLLYEALLRLFSR